MLYGTNTLSRGDLASTTGGITAIRAYSPTMSWPYAGQPWPGSCTIASLKQHDLAGVLAGAYDAELTKALVTLPADALVTLNHEGNGGHHGFAPADWSKALSHLRRLAAVQRPGIKVGAIFTTWPVTHNAQNLAPWVEPDLDWYGLDGYQETPSDTPASVFADAVSMLHDSTAGPVLITETNSAVNPDRWAVDTFTLALQTGMVGYLHFADLATPYPNLPHPTVRAEIATKCALDGILS